MKMTITGILHNRVVRIYPDTDIECENLASYAPLYEPLIATLKKDAGHRHPHLEIRKED